MIAFMAMVYPSVIILLSWLLEAQWLVRVTNFLRIHPAVWIQHSDGEIRAQWLRRTPFGELWCRRLGPIGTAVLLPDGEVKQPCYVKRWCLMNHKGRL